MQEILLLGGGKIGSLIAELLAKSDDYIVHLADKDKSAHSSEKIHYVAMDIQDANALNDYIQQHPVTALISCLPYFYNAMLAQIAKKYQLHYFDLTEDVETANKIKAIAIEASTAFVPQCGLAPGFISIIANDIMQRFSEVDTVFMRVGALPQYPHNTLKYALTWSTEGLINEYGNTCFGIKDAKLTSLQPLEGLETIEIDGLLYEAFNTSGGLGSFALSQEGRVQEMNYKTLRYPGHCEKIDFLMNELKLNDNRPLLKKLLEEALPRTNQDVVIIYVAVAGKKEGVFFEETYVKKIYPQNETGKIWSAIALSTAHSACAIIDLVLKNKEKYNGFVEQESFSLTDFIHNRFGNFYDIKGRA